ncbi:hypothetical protein K1T71_002595 [Dendrolimus kikuchii]|uniref:Uncharacterized protein n=1 Tax=Dendrolimus kikuchii TaxID=765133 RepID=A0ACC1DE28_9NEOP|nr:hypothetical protein K1T71_002595 [Dendrolimus kikuchii]
MPASVGWRHPGKFSGGGAFLLSARRALAVRLLRASAIHFVETYNLTRVLMSVANKYSDDRSRAASLSGAPPAPSEERDGLGWRSAVGFSYRSYSAGGEPAAAQHIY